MDTPRGHNPIAEPAPGLPRHDAPLPGHAPGANFPNLGGGQPWTPPAAIGGFPFPRWMLKWMSRGIYFFAVYLTAPLQAVLYPIAGLAGAALAGAGYLLARATSNSLDTATGWAWNGCFLGLVLAMRVETRLESARPRYVAVRQTLRLALAFLAMTLHEVRERHPLGGSLLAGALAAALLHFALRWKLLRAWWHFLQLESWMRRPGDDPAPTSRDP